jgi:hypothetical protein
MITSRAGLALSTALAIGACQPSAAPAPSTPAAPPPVAATPNTTPPPVGAGALSTDSVVLYQPDAEFAARTSAEEIAALLKSIDPIAARWFTAASPPQTLDIVVVVKPGRRVRYWFVSSRGDDAEAFAGYRRDLAAIQAPEVRAPVVLAVLGSVGGATRSTSGAAFEPPFPSEWRAAIEKAGKDSVQVPDGLLPLVWPD